MFTEEAVSMLRKKRVVNASHKYSENYKIKLFSAAQKIQRVVRYFYVCFLSIFICVFICVFCMSILMNFLNMFMSIVWRYSWAFYTCFCVFLCACFYFMCLQRIIFPWFPSEHVLNSSFYLIFWLFYFFISLLSITNTIIFLPSYTSFLCI